MEWFDLTVKDVKKVTKEATSVTLSIPDSIKNSFSWQPGQHIQLELTIDGERTRRCYSISSTWGQALTFTVKKIQGGKASTYINERLKADDLIKVTAPKGRFTLTPNSETRRSYYFFAAGSGITPIYSMLTTLLPNEPDSFAYLLYSNKDSKSTIFAEELVHLQKKYSDRLIIKHCHSSPGWFDDAPWRKGRIDTDAVHAFINECPPYAQDAQYYLCGPGSFIPDLKKALNEIDVPNTRIHMESFGGAKTPEKPTGDKAILNVNFNGEKHQIPVASNQSLLRAMLAEGIEAPYSCEGGVCGTCRCFLTKGEVSMQNNLVLDETDIKKGIILACQAIPQSKDIEIKYKT
ncbi:ferredoxin--NADP reductase [Alteromonadaceae bacterium M269]|nr:ferredoxin--NADP reductase [Alteromonadaceae bacterium M269]